MYKLGGRYYGPYQVIERIGQVAYWLRLPDEAQIHPVVHISQLKRRLWDGEIVVARLPAITRDGSPIIRPARVSEYRQIKKNVRFRWEVLVEWEALSISEATWKNLDEMRERFPKLVLEDKDILEGNGMMETKVGT